MDSVRVRYRRLSEQLGHSSARLTVRGALVRDRGPREGLHRSPVRRFGLHNRQLAPCTLGCERGAHGVSVIGPTGGMYGSGAP